MSGSEALVEGERKARPWTVKKCQRNNSSVRAPNRARRKYHRYEPGSASPANLSAGQCGELTALSSTSACGILIQEWKDICIFRLYQFFFFPSAAAAAKFRRDSLFCPDELDSLFSYFDTGSGPRSKSTTLSLMHLRYSRFSAVRTLTIYLLCQWWRGCLREFYSMCRVIINVSVAWRCLAPQVLAATAVWEEVLTAARTSWFLVQWWTVSQRKVCVFGVNNIMLRRWRRIQCQ